MSHLCSWRKLYAVKVLPTSTVCKTAEVPINRQVKVYYISLKMKANWLRGF